MKCKACMKDFTQSTNTLPQGFCSPVCVREYESIFLKTIIKRQEKAMRKAHKILEAILGKDNGVTPTMKNIENAAKELEG